MMLPLTLFMLYCMITEGTDDESIQLLVFFTQSHLLGLAVLPVAKTCGVSADCDESESDAGKASSVRMSQQ